MKKVLLILKREYSHRVKKKSFLIMTLLGPLLFGIMLILPVWLSLRNLDDVLIVTYSDEANILSSIQKPDDLFLIPAEKAMAEQPNAYLKIYSDQTSDLIVFNNASVVVPLVKSMITEALIKKRLHNTALTPGVISKITDPVRMEIKYATSEKDFSPAAAIGLIFSIIIYLFILGYSLQVMRGIMEEKNSRVVEVLLSSVKPFQLMAGKILGIGLVSLTQFFIWSVIGGILGFLIAERYGDAFELFTDENLQKTINSHGIGIRQALEWNTIIETFGSVNLIALLMLFIFYFVAGYLFYSAIFAAAGASLDSEAETQQFLFPLTLPILFTFVLGEHIITNPSSDLSFWLSMIPFTSPVAMLLRFSSEVPSTEIFLSMVILIISFIIFTWGAGKIFRSAILWQGKKLTYKDIYKIIRY